MSLSMGRPTFTRAGYVPMRLRSSRVTGFSLLEALVAMAIAAIALASLYRSVGQGSHSVMSVQSRVEAALVAKSVLASGTFAEDLMRQDSGQAGAWSWRIDVAPEQILMLNEAGRPSQAGPLRAAKVTVQVSKDGVAAATWTTWKPYRSAS